MAFVDITGNTYSQLTVLQEVLPRTTPVKWVCKCSCGKTKEIIGASLKNGSTKSCGCLHILTNKKQFTKHGSYLDSLYLVHQAMLQRCTNPSHKSFKHYGGRGISVCPSWHNFESFKEWAISSGYVSGLSLERNNNNAGYSAINCCWANKTQQARNRRARQGYTSKFIGVSWDTQRNKWFVSIGIAGKTVSLGRFSSEILAAKARDFYITENSLEGFVLNFT